MSSFTKTILIVLKCYFSANAKNFCFMSTVLKFMFDKKRHDKNSSKFIIVQIF